MQVTIDQARDRGDTYYFRLICNSDLSTEEQEVREFTYGKDMPLGQIRGEVVAILGNDFGVHPDIPLEYEGDVVEL